MDTFDVMLVDLQDFGCRIYTFITTLRNCLEMAAKHKKAVWVLDRPNPVGRPVEGLTLRAGWESFVGAGPMPMRHGLTIGELGLWFVKHFKLDVEYRIIEMEGWQPDAAPGFGWELGERNWVNPSPNAPNLWMARAYPGTVMVEGTTLSEGRGTTRPLELFGAPDIDARRLIEEMHALMPHWLKGCALRDFWFEPTFHKHVGKLCNGVQIHTEGPGYDHDAFKPWRIQALAFKTIRRLYPDYPLWRDFPYEYESGRLAINVINGSPLLKEWVDDNGRNTARPRRAHHARRTGVAERAPAVSALLRRFRNPAWCPAGRRCSCPASIRRCSRRRSVPTTGSRLAAIGGAGGPRRGEVFGILDREFHLERLRVVGIEWHRSRRPADAARAQLVPVHGGLRLAGVDQAIALDEMHALAQRRAVAVEHA